MLASIFGFFVLFIFLAGPIANVLGFFNRMYEEMNK